MSKDMNTKQARAEIGKIYNMFKAAEHGLELLGKLEATEQNIKENEKAIAALKAEKEKLEKSSKRIKDKIKDSDDTAKELIKEAQADADKILSDASAWIKEQKSKIALDQAKLATREKELADNADKAQKELDDLKRQAVAARQEIEDIKEKKRSILKDLAS